MKNCMFFAAAICAAFLGCVGVSEKKADFAAPKIGFILPMKEPAAADVLDGARLAAQELADGGAKFDILSRDVSGGANPLKAVADLSGEGVRVFCAGFDANIIAYHRTMSSMGGAFFNFMMFYPPATLEGKNSTRIFFNGAQEGGILSAALLKNGGAPLGDITAVCDDSPEWKSMADFAGFELSSSERKMYRDYFTRGESRFDLFAKQIMPLKTSAALYFGGGAEFDAFFKAMRNAGYDRPVARTRGLAPFVRGRDGVYMAVSAFEDGVRTAEGARFAKAFEEKYGRKPSAFAVYGFDSVKLLAKAMLDSGFDVSKMRRSFVSVSRDCAAGRADFDSSADCTTPMVLKK